MLSIGGYIAILLIHRFNLREIQQVLGIKKIDICYMTHNINNYGRWRTTSTTTTPCCTTSSTPYPLVQLPVPPAQPIQLASMPQSNWSHFKPEFAG